MKKLIIKILLISIIVFVTLFVAAYFVFNIIGKIIIEKQLSEVFSAPAKIKAASLSFPLGVNIKGLEIKDFLNTDISIGVNPIGLLAGKIVLNSIVVSKPQLNLIRDNNGVLGIPLKKTTKKSTLPIILSLILRDGKLTFIDRQNQDFQLRVFDINAKVNKRGINTRLAFNFDATADIAEKIARGENFEFSGWIDWDKKDMDANLKMTNMSSNYILPFYKNLLGDSAAPATLDLTSGMKAKDNDLNIKCHMELSGLKRKAKEPEQPEAQTQKETSIIGDLTDLFSSSQGKIVLDFNFNTKLDNPQLNKSEIAPNLIGNAAQNILNKPPEDIVSSVEKIGEKIKAWGKDSGKELKEKGIEEIINIFK